MRNLKCIVVLLALVAAASALTVSLYFGSNAGRTLERPVLADFSSDVCRVRLVRRDGQATGLVRREGGWRLVEPFDGNADPQAVMKLVDALVQTPVADVISDAELIRLGRTRSDFDLEDPLVCAELATEGGETVRLAFGALTPAGDGAYVTVEGVDAVFVVGAALRKAVDVPTDGFRLRSLFSVEAGSVVAFDVKRESSSLLEFACADGGWTVGGEKASSGKIAKYLGELTAANAVSFLWPVGASNETDHATASLLAGYGLDPDSAVTVTLNGVDGVSHRLSFGKGAGEANLVYALVQNGGAIVTVPGALRDFVAQDPVMFTDSRLFPVEARAVDGFSIAADGALYSLSRGREGQWNLESPVSAAADQAAVEAILSRLLALSPADVVTGDGVAVTLSTNMPKAVVSRGSVLGSLTFEALRSREMLRIDPTLVKRIVSTPGMKDAASASVVYDRERRQWNLEKADDDAVSVSKKGVETILAAVNPLTAVRIERLNVMASDLDDYGLDRPHQTVAIDWNADGAVRRNILIGKRTKGGRFATIGSSDAVFVLSDAAVNRLSAPVVDR